MGDYIKLRMEAARISSQEQCGPIPRWDDAFRPLSVSQPRWYEDVYRESESK
jgi:hypothetical protein